MYCHLIGFTRIHRRHNYDDADKIILRLIGDIIEGIIWSHPQIIDSNTPGNINQNYFY